MAFFDEFPLLFPAICDAHSNEPPIVTRTPTSQSHLHLNSVDEWHGFIHIASREFPLFIRVIRVSSEKEKEQQNAVANLQSKITTSTTMNNTSYSASLPTFAPLRTLLSKSSSSTSPPSLTSFTLLVKSDESLSDCLKGYESVLSQCWEQTHSVEKFLLELREIAARVLRNQSSNPLSATASNLTSPAGFSTSASQSASSHLLRVLAEIKLLPQGFDTIESGPSHEAREMVLKYVDIAQRKHLMKIKLPETYPKSMALTVTTELPIDFDTSLPSSISSSSSSSSISPDRLTASSSPIRFLYDRVVAVVDSLQLFWSMLDDLCTHAWILEPEKPIPRSTREVRLALGKSCWLEVNIDPRAPFAVPALLRVYGNETVAAPLQAKLQHALETNQWGRAPDDIDPNTEDILMMNAEEAATSDPPLDDNSRRSYVRRNLLHVLGMSSLPLPTETNRQDFNLECPICTSYHLEDAVPDIVCSNPKCESSYHRDCLVQWFQSDPTTQNIFGALHGTCVICASKIVVRL